MDCIQQEPEAHVGYVVEPPDSECDAALASAGMSDIPILVLPSPSPPPPPAPAPPPKTTLASLIAEEHFNIFWLLSIIIPVFTAIVGEAAPAQLLDTH